MRKFRVPQSTAKRRAFWTYINRRQGSVELEAVLITAVMFPLATALYYLAISAFAVLHRMIAGILEWPYLCIG